MFQVLEKAGMPGVTVSAFDLVKREAVWQTWLAAPLVAAPTLGRESGKLTAVTASGGVFRSLLAGKPLDKPWEPVLAIDASRLTKPLCSLLPLPGEMFAMTGGADTSQIVIYDPKEQDKQFRWLLCPREMSVRPGIFAGGLLTACDNGQVFLLDAEARGEMAKPLPPVVEGVTTWDWRAPLAVDDKLAVLCDGDKRLMAIRIGRDKDGEAALTEVAAVVTKNGLVSPVAALGKVVFVVARRGRCDRQPAELRIAETHPGQVAVTGGALRVGAAAGRQFGARGHREGPFIGDRRAAAGGLAVGFGLWPAGRRAVSLRRRDLSGCPQRHALADLGGRRQRARQGRCRLSLGHRSVGRRSRVLIGGHEGSLFELKKP